MIYRKVERILWNIGVLVPKEVKIYRFDLRDLH